MTHTDRQTANLLGALALALADRVQEVAADVARHGASGPAALVALDGHAAGASIDGLRRVLGLTHSGTVRLVDRVAAGGLLERRTGADARAVSLHLTPAGRRLARRIAAAREGVLAGVLTELSPSRRTMLNSLLTDMFAGLHTTPEDVARVCRLCDAAACGTCPVQGAERRAV